MYNKIKLAANQQFFQLLCPQILGCHVLEGGDFVTVTGGVLGLDIEFILRVLLSQRLHDKISLSERKLRFARADVERLSLRGGRRGSRHGGMICTKRCTTVCSCNLWTEKEN